jgi:hypothetical protein
MPKFDPFIEMDKMLSGPLTSTLNSETVAALFANCIADPTDQDGMEVEAILHPVKLSRKKVEHHRGEIARLLTELPRKFHSTAKGGGGGGSFLDAFTDRHGHQWTGLHIMMERLFQLGLATGQARFCVPREDWHELPGGMPYLVVDPDDLSP